MNTQSPLIPQGSLLEQKNKGRARVRIAVFVVLAIHGIGLLALLMQGCKKEPEPQVPPDAMSDTNLSDVLPEPTNAVPAFAEPTNTTAFVTPTNLPISNEPVLPVNPPPITPPPVVTEYKITAGDTYSSIAKKFNVSTRAMIDANPGVDPTKLRVGQTIKVPPPSAPSTSGTTPPSTAAPTAQVYTVRSGDTLTSIGAKFGVTPRAIRAANNLTTDRITVGQKLTIPAKAVPKTGSTAPAEASPTGTAPIGQ